MKKLFFITLFLSAMGINSYAQIKEGGMYIGGTVSYTGTHNKTSDYKTTNFSLVPSFGYFINNKLSAGLSLGYNSSSSEDSLSKQIENSLEIGPFMRQYFGDSGRFSFFIEENLIFTPGTITYKYTGYLDEKVKNTGIMISVFPGICFFPSSRVGLEASFGSLYYKLTKEKNESTGTTDKNISYGLNLNLNTFYFGLKYYF